MIFLPTQADLEATYLLGAQSEAASLGSDIDITQFSDYQIKAAAQGGVNAGMIQEFNRYFNNIYPQYSDEQGLNLQLANGGIPGIFPSSPAILSLTAVGLIVDLSYAIPVGTILTAPNGATYSVISVTSDTSEAIVTLGSPIFYVASTLTGINTTQANATVLTLSPPIFSTDLSSSFSTASVNGADSTDGTNQESLADATNRLIEIEQTPLDGTRRTDFKYLAINPANNVTDAIVLINNQLTYTDATINVGVFDVSGVPITDDILNLGLFAGTTEVIFSRTSSTGSIDNTQSAIDAQDIVGVFANVSTVSTQELTSLTGIPDPFFKIVVTLQNGFTLSSQIILDGNQFTLYQLIQREARRAICAQPYGATLTYDLTTGEYLTSSFAISAIEQQLDTALGTPTTAGILGSYLIDRTITTWNGSNYVYVSSISLNLGIPVANTDKLPWIYDVSTTVGQIYINILVEAS